MSRGEHLASTKRALELVLAHIQQQLLERDRLGLTRRRRLHPTRGGGYVMGATDVSWVMSYICPGCHRYLPLSGDCTRLMAMVMSWVLQMCHGLCLESLPLGRHQIGGGHVTGAADLRRTMDCTNSKRKWTVR